MSKNLYIDASHPNETRVVLKSNNHIEDYEYESINNTLIKNNIYLGKVSRIEPSLQAAFVDFGRERHGFLSFNDIQSDYYQLPLSDLEKIKQEEEKVREELSKQSENIEDKILEGKEEIKIDDHVEKKEEFYLCIFLLFLVDLASSTSNNSLFFDILRYLQHIYFEFHRHTYL